MDPEQEAQDVTVDEPAQTEAGEVEAGDATPADDTPVGEERLQALERQAGQAREEAAANSELAAALRAQLTDAHEAYRALLLQRDPDVPAELVGGENIAELEASYERASALVEQLRLRAVEKAARDAERAAQERVPAGAPARRGADLANLTPQEKIMLGLQRGN
ncbi:MAG: hypothetical protein OXC99_12730 [Chloroflexi bacterium]|nr:hypothetical protein [Chloroflexota bacterium]